MRHDVTFPLLCRGRRDLQSRLPGFALHYQHDPVQTTKTSVHGAINLLGLAKRLKCRIFQASTSEVYGDPFVAPADARITGATSIRSVRGLATTKASDAPKRCSSTITASTTSRSRLRASSIPMDRGCSPDDGRVVSNFIVQALNGEPITIYGDGSQTRSFCYVDDLIEGFMRLMASPADVTGPVNLGNPGEFTIEELAELVVEMTGSSSELIYLPLPQNDPQQRQPDITLAK